MHGLADEITGWPPPHFNNAVARRGGDVRRLHRAHRPRIAIPPAANSFTPWSATTWSARWAASGPPLATTRPWRAPSACCKKWLGSPPIRTPEGELWIRHRRHMDRTPAYHRRRRQVAPWAVDPVPRLADCSMARRGSTIHGVLQGNSSDLTQAQQVLADANGCAYAARSRLRAVPLDGQRVERVWRVGTGHAHIAHSPERWRRQCLQRLARSCWPGPAGNEDR